MEKKTVKKIIYILIPCIIISVAVLLYLIKNINSKPEEIEPEPEVIPCEVVEHNKVYLAIGEEYELDEEGYISRNNTIADVDGKKVVGVKVGKNNL